LTPELREGFNPAMTGYPGRYIDPVKDEKQVYPYRPVWVSILIENGILVGIAIVVYILVNLIGLELPSTLIPIVNVGLIILPILLWLLLSALREQATPQPRARLPVVLIISALATNAVALPFIDLVLQPHRWLPLENAVNRVVGYTFSVGIVSEVTQYIVLRALVWHDLLRIRTDAVAYSVAAALGFSTVVNIQFILGQPQIAPDIVAFRVVENTTIHIAAILFISLGLAETYFDRPSPFFMTITLALAALILGISNPILSGLTNAVFSVRGAFPRPLVGFGYSIALLLITMGITAFLFSAAERRAQEVSKQES